MSRRKLKANANLPNIGFINSPLPIRRGNIDVKELIEQLQLLPLKGSVSLDGSYIKILLNYIDKLEKKLKN